MPVTRVLFAVLVFGTTFGVSVLLDWTDLGALLFATALTGIYLYKAGKEGWSE
jgi:hypothetical protein